MTMLRKAIPAALGHLAADARSCADEREFSNLVRRKYSTVTDSPLATPISGLVLIGAAVRDHGFLSLRHFFNCANSTSKETP